jgi:hypothetical protein
MDHSEAMHMRAVERYMLADLSVSEVEEFERHFFDCPQCSEELRTLTILQDNARAVFVEPVPSPVAVSLPAVPVPPGTKAGWWRDIKGLLWLRPSVAAPAFALLVIALLAGYETGIRRPGMGIQPISAYPLYAASRGEETVIAPPAGAEFYSLYMDRTWERDFPSYKAVLQDDAGATERFSMNLTAPAPGRPIYVLTPVRALSDGKHVLRILGIDDAGKETEVARYPFTLRFK